jgi:pilus assembly protein CpaB
MDRRALMIALVVALLGVVLLFLYTKRFEREASGGEKIRLLVAVKPIERGKPITEEMLSTHEVPMAYVEDRAIKEVDKSKILGIKVGTTIQAQQTLMWTDLTTANEERRDLSSLIVPGSRAVTIRTRREDASSAMVKPGDYCDVIAILPDGNTETAIILLQRVLVLASGFDTSPDAIDLTANKDRRLTESVLTLSLSLEDAQKLAVATEHGTVTVVLRGPQDIAKNDPGKYQATQLLPKDRVQAVATATGPTAIQGRQ